MNKNNETFENDKIYIFWEIPTTIHLVIMIIYRIFIFINNKYEDIFGRCFEIICKCINFCECEECKRCKICDCFYFNKNKEI